LDDALLVEYHDRMGVPAIAIATLRGARSLGAQAGLNWSLVLKKREAIAALSKNSIPRKSRVIPEDKFKHS